jgi:hypothetical protein
MYNNKIALDLVVVDENGIVQSESDNNKATFTVFERQTYLIITTLYCNSI